MLRVRTVHRLCIVGVSLLLTCILLSIPKNVHKPSLWNTVENDNLATTKDQLLQTDFVMVPTAAKCPLDPWLEMTKMDHWQQLSGRSPSIYMYSAYYDEANIYNTTTITIVAVSKMSVEQTDYIKHCTGRSIQKYTMPDVQCKLWFANDHQKLVKTRIACHMETGNRDPMAMFYFFCPVKVQDTPCAVSILREPQETANNVMMIHNNRKDYLASNNMIGEFAVCVKTIYRIYRYKNYMQFIEFIELNRILGVEHFTFYLDSANQIMTKVFHYYTEMGIIDVLPYQIDVLAAQPKEIHRITAPLSDCMLRYRHRYKYVLMVDLDEFIIPNKHKNLRDMMTEIHTNPYHASFQFKNGFFSLKHKSDYTIKDNLGLVSLTKTKRERIFTSFGVRSKFIVVPEKVTMPGNHFSMTMLPNFTEMRVDPSIAYSHHYRVWTGNIKTVIADKSAHMYATQLVSNVKHVLDTLQLTPPYQHVGGKRKKL